MVSGCIYRARSSFGALVSSWLAGACIGLGRRLGAVVSSWLASACVGLGRH